MHLKYHIQSSLSAQRRSYVSDDFLARLPAAAASRKHLPNTFMRLARGKSRCQRFCSVSGRPENVRVGKASEWELRSTPRIHHPILSSACSNSQRELEYLSLVTAAVKLGNRRDLRGEGHIIQPVEQIYCRQLAIFIKYQKLVRAFLLCFNRMSDLLSWTSSIQRTLSESIARLHLCIQTRVTTVRRAGKQNDLTSLFHLLNSLCIMHWSCLRAFLTWPKQLPASMLNADAPA